MRSSGWRWVIFLSFPVSWEMCQLWSCLSALAFSILNHLLGLVLEDAKWQWFWFGGKPHFLERQWELQVFRPFESKELLTMCRSIGFNLVLSIGILNFWSCCHVFVRRNKYSWELGGDWFLSEFRGVQVYGSYPPCKAHGSHWRLINSDNQSWTKS